MRLSVGLMEGRDAIDVELNGVYVDQSGEQKNPGGHRFTAEIALTPATPDGSFTLNDVMIGIGFHWERRQRQTFRGGLRILKKRDGLTAINEIGLEDYVLSVISSEMSASCPAELLKAHAVISRSWMWYPKAVVQAGAGTATIRSNGEIIRWYGREAHADFDVCADDHCQRYQGITRAFSPSVEQAVRATAGQMLTYDGVICDARFYKCCGGMTENYSVAWDDREVPYLVSVYDGPGSCSPTSAEDWIRSRPPAYCNTSDPALLAQILPDFDRETPNFYRWRVEYGREELGAIVRDRLGEDLGRIQDLQPLARGVSGRIYRLKISGSAGSLIVGKELEIRRVLSRSHLYSSAFVVEKSGDRLTLIGAGWGHGVGLCQIGAAVMASEGRGYREILSHYYPGTTL